MLATVIGAKGREKDFFGFFGVWIFSANQKVDYDAILRKFSGFGIKRLFLWLVVG